MLEYLRTFSQLQKIQWHRGLHHSIDNFQPHNIKKNLTSPALHNGLYEFLLHTQLQLPFGIQIPLFELKFDNNSPGFMHQGPFRGLTVVFEIGWPFFYRATKTNKRVLGYFRKHLKKNLYPNYFSIARQVNGVWCVFEVLCMVCRMFSHC